MRETIVALRDRVIAGQALSAEQAISLTVLSAEDLYELFYAANRIRRHFRGDKVAFCSVINARSGKCSMDCAFCAQSEKHGTEVEEYQLVSSDDVLDAARSMSKHGIGGFGIVTSGPQLSEEDFSKVLGMVAKLKQTGLNPCASLGILDEERAARLKQAGLYRYHHNLETARSFYPRVCTTQDYAKKVQTVKLVKAAGLKSCSGGIFGLGEEWSHRVEMALSLRELAVDAVPINFLNAVPGTPLAKEAAIPAMEALQIIAIYRFLLPDVEIKVCGGRERILGELQPLMYLAGADGTMVGNYLTTSGRPAAEDEAMVERLGLKIKARENDELGPEGQDAT